jgi:hypothetical protein
VNRLNKEINAALADPKMLAKFSDLGGEMPPAPAPISATPSLKTRRSGPRSSAQQASRLSDLVRFTLGFGSI